MYVCRFRNVVLRCQTPRLHCFLSSHLPSFKESKICLRKGKKERKKEAYNRKFCDIGSADLVMKYLCINLLRMCIKPKKHITPEPKKDILLTCMHL